MSKFTVVLHDECNEFPVEWVEAETVEAAIRAARLKQFHEDSFEFFSPEGVERELLTVHVVAVFEGHHVAIA